MAEEHLLDLLKQGVYIWNAWRKEHPDIGVDLRGADLSKATLHRADLRGANLKDTNLRGADLRGANLREANLRGANLSHADLNFADLRQADLRQANLRGAYLKKVLLHQADLRDADLRGAYLGEADLRKADLSKAYMSRARFHNANLSRTNLMEVSLRRADLLGANLEEASLIGADLSKANLSEANLSRADLTGCTVYAISAWDVHLEETIQSNLIITKEGEPTVTVDHLEVAQFVYLLLNNKKIREVIDSITSKVVLILGRFTEERKKVLEALRDELRKQNYTPVVFDFEKPVSRDFTETISTLAHLARFIIADLTEPSSIPQELQAIIPNLEVPVQPLLLEAKREYAMFVDFRKYQWVLPVYLYKDQTSLLASLKKEIIEPAEQKARELALEKAKRLERP